MDRVLAVVEKAKAAFRERLNAISDRGGITKEMYIRYLSFQHHLTNGVQKHFLSCASHPSMTNKRKLREFLFRFGLEEEPHFYVAELDLRQLGCEPLPCPLDVALWWAYFDRIVVDRPFVRLGATCVLENLGAGAGGLGHDLLKNAPYLNKENTRFLQIHFHEVLPHGDQIIGALRSVRLQESEISDLIEGANTGTILYLRMANWALGLDDLAREFPIELRTWRLKQNEPSFEFDLSVKGGQNP
jgi:hypothetical protein